MLAVSDSYLMHPNLPFISYKESHTKWGFISYFKCLHWAVNFNEWKPFWHIYNCQYNEDSEAQTYVCHEQFILMHENPFNVIQLTAHKIRFQKVKKSMQLAIHFKVWKTLLWYKHSQMKWGLISWIQCLLWVIDFNGWKTFLSFKQSHKKNWFYVIQTIAHKEWS